MEFTHWTDDDRREFRRAPAAEEVALRCAGGEFLLTARDVSEGGLGAAALDGLEAGAEGSVEFISFPVACRCRVVYSIHGKGLGIEFLDLSEESRAALRNFVKGAN